METNDSAGGTRYHLLADDGAGYFSFFSMTPCTLCSGLTIKPYTAMLPIGCNVAINISIPASVRITGSIAMYLAFLGSEAGYNAADWAITAKTFSNMPALMWSLFCLGALSEGGTVALFEGAKLLGHLLGVNEEGFALLRRVFSCSPMQEHTTDQAFSSEDSSSSESNWQRKLFSLGFALVRAGDMGVGAFTNVGAIGQQLVSRTPNPSNAEMYNVTWPLQGITMWTKMLSAVFLFTLTYAVSFMTDIMGPLGNPWKIGFKEDRITSKAYWRICYLSGLSFALDHGCVLASLLVSLSGATGSGLIGVALFSFVLSGMTLGVSATLFDGRAVVEALLAPAVEKNQVNRIQELMRDPESQEVTKTKEEVIQEIIKDMLDKPEFKQNISEWASLVLQFFAYITPLIRGLESTMSVRLLMLGLGCSESMTYLTMAAIVLFSVIGFVLTQMRDAIKEIKHYTGREADLVNRVSDAATAMRASFISHTDEKDGQDVGKGGGNESPEKNMQGQYERMCFFLYRKVDGCSPTDDSVMRKAEAEEKGEEYE